MGKAKVKMELMRDQKARILTFNRRKKCLVQKLEELTTLCDVRACMVIYGNSGPEIWPQNVDEIHQIMEAYRAKKMDSGCKKFDLSDYFNARKMEVEKELSKLREKKNMDSKYPMLNLMNESELREFGAALRNKAEFLKSRIELLRNKHPTSIDFNLYDHTMNQNIGFEGTSSDSRFMINYPPSPIHELMPPSCLQFGFASMDFGDSGPMQQDDQFGFGGSSSEPPQLDFSTTWEKKKKKNDDGDHSLEDFVNYHIRYGY